MTARERVLAALRREPVDFVPFVVYENKLPMGAADRRLRNAGLALCQRGGTVYRTHTPGIDRRTVVQVENGATVHRTTITTPRGELTTVTRPQPDTTWTLEHLFRSPDDYEPLLALIEAERYELDESSLRATEQRWGDDALCRVALGYSPLQWVIYRAMGPLRFAEEWHDRRGDVEQLLAALARNWSRLVQVVARSSAPVVNVCGNQCPEVLGRERFAQWVLPYLEEACEALQPTGKLVGTHLDSNNRLWADLVAGSRLDYIEAFTPPPDGDLSVAEARSLWPDKVLWINFPSSRHLQQPERIAATARHLIDEAGDGAGFLIGVTENVPEDRWEESFETILRVCREAGPRPRSSA